MAILQRLAAAWFAAGLAGCAALQPMIPVPAETGTGLIGPAELTAAIKEAKQFQLDYESAYSGVRTAKQVLGWATWLGGSSAIGIVLSGGAGQFPVGFGVGAAGLGAASNSMLPTGNTAIYAAGAKVVGCAYEALLPAAAAAAVHDSFKTALTGLDTALAPFESDTDAADQAILDRARRVLQAGFALEHQVQTGGAALRKKLHDIKREVDLQIAKSEPDPNAILKQLAAMQAGGLAFPSGIAGVGAAVKGGMSAGGGKTPARMTDISRLAVAIAALEPYLSAENVSLAACTTDDATPPQVFEVSGDTIEMPPTGSKQFPVTASAQPVALLSDSGAAGGVTAAITRAADKFYVLTLTTTNAATGDRTLDIVGSNGLRAPRLIVRVGTAKTSGTHTLTPPAGESAKNPTIDDAKLQAQDKTFFADAGKLTLDTIALTLGFAATATPPAEELRVRAAKIYPCVANARRDLYADNPKGWLYTAYANLLKARDKDNKPNAAVAVCTKTAGFTS